MRYPDSLSDSRVRHVRNRLFGLRCIDALVGVRLSPEPLHSSPIVASTINGVLIMTAGILFLGIALAAFAMMGILHKVGDRLRCQPVVVAAITMSSGAAIAAVRASIDKNVTVPGVPWTVLALAIPFGLCAVAALSLFQEGVKHGSIATSWLLLNLSVVIPTGGSILLFGETLSLRTAIALVLIVAAVVCIWWDMKQIELKRSVTSDMPSTEGR